MPIIKTEEIKEVLTKDQTILGLDLGTKNIGVAISDAMLFSASPMTTIRSEKFSSTVLELKSIIDEKNVGVVVIGLPLNMNGTEGPRCQASRSFAQNLIKSDLLDPELYVAFQDERMSTCAVERAMIAGDLSRKRRKEVVDKSAASFILQGVLDRLRNI